MGDFTVKVCILIILFVLTLGLVYALSIDDSINTVFNDANIENHAGDSYLIYYNFNGNFPDEDGAYGYIAGAALLFQWIQNDLCEYTQTSATDKIATVKYIACPYGGDDDDYIAIIPMSGINDAVIDAEAEGQDQSELYDLVLSYVKSYSRTETLDNFLDN
jgi:hypothetical protein